MNNIAVYVPLSPVKLMFDQKELSGKWINWVTIIQENDLDMKPTKDIKGQGLCKLVVE